LDYSEAYDSLTNSVEITEPIINYNLKTTLELKLYLSPSIPAWLA